MVVAGGLRALAVLVVGCCVHQDVQAGFPAGGYRDHRDAQHFRQAVQVDLHAPLLDNVHHVQGQDHRLAQLDQLQSQIQVALQGRGVRHIDDHIHVVAQYVLPGHLFLHGVGGQAVGAGQVHQFVLVVVELENALLFLHRYTGPVGHFQVGAGVGVEQRGFSAVGVSHEPNGKFMCQNDPLLLTGRQQRGCGWRSPVPQQTACPAL